MNNYFRVATTDDLQGPAMADYAYDTLKVTKLGVASDNEVYGKGIADTFSAEFKNKGGTIVKRQDFNTKSTNDFRGFLQSAKGAGATAIYFGGTDSNKGCIVRAQAKGIFAADSPYMGGDGLQTAQWDAFMMTGWQGGTGPVVDLLEWKVPAPVGGPHESTVAIGGHDRR